MQTKRKWVNNFACIFLRCFEVSWSGVPVSWIISMKRKMLAPRNFIAHKLMHLYFNECFDIELSDLVQVIKLCTCACVVSGHLQDNKDQNKCTLCTIFSYINDIIYRHIGIVTFWCRSTFYTFSCVVDLRIMWHRIAKN